LIELLGNGLRPDAGNGIAHRILSADIRIILLL